MRSNFALAMGTWLLLACHPESTASSETAAPSASTSAAAARSKVTVKLNIIGMSMLNTKKADTPLTVLMPEITGHANHERFVYAQDIYAMNAATGRSLSDETDADGKKYKVLVLGRETLSLGTTPVETGITYSLDPVACPEVDKPSTLYLAPSLSQVLGKSLGISTAHDAVKAGSRTAVAMRLENGKLYSFPKSQLVWQFKEEKDKLKDVGHKQVLTGVVVNEFTVELGTGEGLVVQSVAEGSTTAANLVTLYPQNGLIEFYIGNTLPDQRLPQSGIDTDVDEHFPAMYDLVGESSTVKPFKTAKDCNNSAPSTTLVNCGPDRP